MTDPDYLADASRSIPVHGQPVPIDMGKQTIGSEAAATEVVRRPPYPHLGWAVVWTIVFLFAQVIAMFFGGIFLLILYVIRHGITFDNEIFLKLCEENLSRMILLTTFATFLMAMLILFVVHRRHALRYSGVRRMVTIHSVLVTLFVLPVQIIALEVANWAALVLPQFDTGLTEMIEPMSLCLSFVAVCLLPGLGEEIFFRGFVSRGLVGHYGIVAGSIFTSFLFAVVHVDPVQATGCFVLGLFMQFVFLMTRSLYGPILLHILHNFVAVLLLHLLPAEAETAVNHEIIFTPLPVLLAASACTWVFVFLLYQTRTRWFFVDGMPWSPGYVTAESPPVSLNLVARNMRPSGLTIVVAGISYVMMIMAIFRTEYW